jgi:hypothetical protein
MVIVTFLKISSQQQQLKRNDRTMRANDIFRHSVSSSSSSAAAAAFVVQCVSHKPRNATLKHKRGSQSNTVLLHSLPHSSSSLLIAFCTNTNLHTHTHTPTRTDTLLPRYKLLDTLTYPNFTTTSQEPF